MNETAVIFLKWWNAMALMYERYGDAHDIEDKPEWEEVQQLQRGWLEHLRDQTGSDPEALFDTIQLAITDVLGITDNAVTLDLETAETIVRKAVERVLGVEVRQAKASGMVN